MRTRGIYFLSMKLPLHGHRLLIHLAQYFEWSRMFKVLRGDLSWPCYLLFFLSAVQLIYGTELHALYMHMMRIMAKWCPLLLVNRQLLSPAARIKRGKQSMAPWRGSYLFLEELPNVTFVQLFVNHRTSAGSFALGFVALGDCRA